MSIMDKADMKANLFELGELIDEANRCETDFRVTIDQIVQIVQICEKSNDLNNTLLKVKLNHLKKVWKEREQFDELRIKLNTIY